MSDDREKTRASFEWGLASLLGGGFLLVAAVLALQLLHSLEVSNYRSVGRDHLHLLAYGGYAGIGLCTIAALIAFVAGVTSLVHPQAQDRPKALGVMATMIGFLAVAMWIALGIGRHTSLSSRL
jgi:hypothetical protein